MKATETALPSVSELFLRTLAVRLLMFAVLGGSVWLVWWSFQRLTDVLHQSQQKSSQVSALGNEVQRLEQIRDRAEIQRIESRYEEAQSAVFSGPEQFMVWTNALREQTRALNLDTTIAQGHSQVQSNLNVVIRHVTVDLEPSYEIGRTNSPYERVLSFAGLWEKAKQRVDLVQFTVFGDFNSVRHARAVFELWSASETGGGK
jgi:hypothetical protein